jgi:hypothetical protein
MIKMIKMKEPNRKKKGNRKRVGSGLGKKMRKKRLQKSRGKIVRFSRLEIRDIENVLDTVVNIP